MNELKMVLRAAALVSLAGATPAFAVSASECSAKYESAKSDGTLHGASYSEFRRTACGADAGAGGGSIRLADAAKTTTAPAPAANGPVFPTAVSPAHAAEAPGAARRHTCSDQFKANKPGNANGGLKWIQKGGGYYSQCNKKLRG